MIEILYPFELMWSSTGTHLKFCCEEEGPTTVELTVQAPGENYPKRVRLRFIGAPCARLNDDSDRKVSGEYLLMQIRNSEWVESHLEAYVQRFGKTHLAVVNNMQHFIVHGHDLTIGVLARKVECTEIDAT